MFSKGKTGDQNWGQVNNTGLSKMFVKKQTDGRYRFWGRISEYGNQYLRVVTLKDKKTIHNAFFDQDFKEVK